MTFDELLTQITELLQRQGRVSYGALKRRYSLDDDYLQDVKDELIDAQQIAVDEDGKILVWLGRQGNGKEDGRAGEETPEFEGAHSPRSKVQSQEAHSSIPDSRFSDPGHRTLDSGRNTAERRQLTVMFCDLVGSTA
ncbi:MAG: hypothetical protein FJ147_19775 [Deltaproteobacteria bacterium]|nr:hypothetical protein [Deltaproteobacteria bacterium]